MVPGGKPESNHRVLGCLPTPPGCRSGSAIFEVLSPSTEAFDRGEKFRGYRRIETLTDYVLVSCDRARIEQHIRQPSGVWTREEWIGPEGVLQLNSLDCELPLLIFRKVI